MTDDVERIGAAMWRAEAVDAGTPDSVALGRTPEEFRDMGDVNRAKWIKFARAALSAMPPREVTGWQPIETAPKDAIILLYRPTAPSWGMVSEGRWNDQSYHKKPNPYWEMWIKVGGTTDSRQHEPSHWMPLPPAPEVL